jgi:hypothetical protein
MLRRYLCLAVLVLPACAIAFTPGLKPTPPPEKFQDIDNSPSKEIRDETGAAPPSTPAFGMSLVVGGNKMDSGALPKPPIPVVLLP